MNELTIGQFLMMVKEILKKQDLLRVAIPLENCITGAGIENYSKHILNFSLLTQLMVGAGMKSLEGPRGISLDLLQGSSDELLSQLSAKSQALLTVMCEQALSVCKIRPQSEELWSILRDTSSRAYFTLVLALKGVEVLTMMKEGVHFLGVNITEEEILVGIKQLLSSGPDEDGGSFSIAC